MKNQAHLTNPPANAKAIVAWHTKLDIAAYSLNTEKSKEVLVIGGQVIDSDFAVQIVVNLCGESPKEAKKIIKAMCGIEL